MAIPKVVDQKIIDENFVKWNIPRPDKDYRVVVHCSTYKHESYIEDALKGFVMQKTNFPFCAIVIDDGSPDRTPAIIKQYAASYPDIIKPILLGENHMQHGMSRNPYFEEWHKRTKYIALCEGDDYWTDPYKLQKQVAYMETNKDCVICAHNAYKYYVGNQKLELFSAPVFSSRYLFTDIVEKDWFVPTAAIVYRQDIFTQHCPMKSFFNGDYSLQLHLLSSGGYLFYMSDVMSVYRLHENGVSNIPLEEMNLRTEKLLDYIDSYTNFQYHLNILHKKKRLQNILDTYRANIRKQQKTQTIWYKIRYFILKVVRFLLGLRML